jgi:hybrid cluster-associated redox disulfide protein
MDIKKDTKINEIISAYPDVVNFFTDLGMSCGQCFAVNFDTIENGALMHGMDVSKLIDQLNQYIATLPTPTVSPHPK